MTNEELIREAHRLVANGDFDGQHSWDEGRFVARLADALEQSVRDSQRLDWMENDDAELLIDVLWPDDVERPASPTIRNAIDAAMSSDSTISMQSDTQEETE